MRRAVRRSIVTAVLVLTSATAACTGTGDTSSSTSGVDPSTLPHQEPPIPGLQSDQILAAARLSIPGGNERFTVDLPNDKRPTRTTVIEAVGAGGATSPYAGTPLVRVEAEPDGTVLYVSCEDLDSAGLSPVIAVCTDLALPGVPAGGLPDFWKSILAGNWHGDQPYPSVTLRGLDFEARTPVPGRAVGLAISGPEAPGATNTSDL